MNLARKAACGLVITAASASAEWPGSSMVFAASRCNVAAGSASSGTSFNWTATTTGTSPQAQFVDTTSVAVYARTSAVAHGTAGCVDFLSNGSPVPLEILNNPTLSVRNVSGFGCALAGFVDNDTAKLHAIHEVTAHEAAFNPITLTSNP